MTNFHGKFVTFRMREVTFTRKHKEKHVFLWCFALLFVTLHKICARTGCTSAKSELSALGLHRPCSGISHKYVFIMATVVLQVPDESLVSKVKNACKMLVGVASVKVHKATKKKDYDITKTAGYREAMDDVKNGRVTTYDSVDDMFKKLGINV